MEENWTRAVALLGGRGRRAGKKGRHRKGRQCRIPFHENQSVLLTFSGRAGLPDYFLADFIGLVFRFRNLSFCDGIFCRTFVADFILLADVVPVEADGARYESGGARHAIDSHSGKA